MKKRTAFKVTPDGKRERIESAIVSEFAVNLYVNDKLQFNMICTPEKIKELAVGRLLTEGVITCYDNLVSAYSDDENKNIYFDIEFYENHCERSYVNLPDVLYEESWVFALANAFVIDGELHRKTKAVHSCMLARRGEILFTCEDIGRHNAMDKAIGYMYLNNLNPAECMLFTSGRVPTEMAHKAIMAGIPILISKAVPTDKAIEMAKKYNLRLICKAWPDSFEVFN